MKLGVLSDTHGIFHPGIVELFDGVDMILHAGDIGRDGVLAQLKQIAPVVAVRGNMDSAVHFTDVPAYRVITAGEQRILITHRVGNPLRPPEKLTERLRQVRPDAVVFGHTHRPFNERIAGILFFNPGSAGKRSHEHPLTVGFLSVGGEGVFGSIAPLERVDGR